jgi:hypothetical protein
MWFSLLFSSALLLQASFVIWILPVHYSSSLLVRLLACINIAPPSSPPPPLINMSSPSDCASSCLAGSDPLSFSCCLWVFTIFYHCLFSRPSSFSSILSAPSNVFIMSFSPALLLLFCSWVALLNILNLSYPLNDSCAGHPRIRHRKMCAIVCVICRPNGSSASIHHASGLVSGTKSLPPILSLIPYPTPFLRQEHFQLLRLDLTWSPKFCVQ